MSLDNIQLSPFIIHDLFRKCLVDLNTDESISSHQDSASINFLGGNQQKITILSNNPGATYLTDGQLQFLTDILAACKLNMGDVSIINLYKSPAINHLAIDQQLSPKVYLLFGISPDRLELPFNVPMFQLQRFNNRVYLVAPSLDELAADKTLKRQLWINLQQIFLSK